MKKKNKIVITGGSRIGSVNETFPFSRLIIEPQKLTLKTTFSGTIEISSREILSLKEVYHIPIIAQGIKIEQKNPNYKKTLIFWSFKDPKKIIMLLEEKGLWSAAAKLSSSSEKQESSGSEFSKKIKVLTSPPLLVLYAAMLLFAAFIEYKSRHKYDGYKRIDRASNYQLEVKKMFTDHGTVSLNDSILVSGGSKLISERPEWFRHKNKPLLGEYPMPPNFSQLEPPFEIIKDPDIFNLQVVKWGDTLVFQIPDPNYKDPRDPSFGDVFDMIFEK